MMLFSEVQRGWNSRGTSLQAAFFPNERIKVLNHWFKRISRENIALEGTGIIVGIKL